MQKVTENINGLLFSYDASLRDRYILERVVVDNIYGVSDDLKDSLVIDIGAHIGAFSIFASSKGAQVIAIEPRKQNYDLLLENIAQNNLTSVTALHCAISYFQGNSRLYVSDWCSGCNSLNVFSNASLSADKYEEVEAITIISIFEKYLDKYCKLLKIDCEGAETFIIPDVLKSFSQSIEAMAIEFHSQAFFDNVESSIRSMYPLVNQISPLEWKFSKYPES